MLTDLRYAFRQLLKSRGFTFVAIVTLALGIGANTAVFSVVDAVLLRALPYHDADRLIDLFTMTPAGDRDAASVPEFEELRDQMRSLEDLTAFQSQSVNITGGERPDRIRGAFVSANFFDVFHLTPVAGRVLAKGEDQPGAAKIAVVSEKLWRERLSGNSDLADKKLLLNGEAYSVVGVLPSSFQHPFDPDVAVWLSMMNYPGLTKQRELRRMTLLGHLKRGVSVAQAQAEANTIASQWVAAYPKENAGRGMKIDLFRDVAVGNALSILILLFAAAGAILLISCANLANLLLARGLARQREMAVRAALGASRWRLIRQLLTETTVLGLAGGLAGVLLAHWGFVGFAETAAELRQRAGCEHRFTRLVFRARARRRHGLALRPDPGVPISPRRIAKWFERRRPRQRRECALEPDARRLRRGAGRVFNSPSDCGGPAHPQLRQIAPERGRLRVEEHAHPRVPAPARRRTRKPTRPGISIGRCSTGSRKFPGSNPQRSCGGCHLPGTPARPAWLFSIARRRPPAASRRSFSISLPADFFAPRKSLCFAAVSLTSRSGPTLRCRSSSTRQWPAVFGRTRIRSVNRSSSSRKKEWSGLWSGVVGDTKQFALNDPPTPQLYACYSQQPVYFATLVVRTNVEPLSLSEPVRQAIWRVDPDQPMWKIRSVDWLVERSVADRKFLLALMIMFAALALALTVIGLYGVISYLVTQRTQEIGIRMALGAQVGHILQLILKHGVALVSLGVVIGLVAAIFATRLMSHLLYGVTATDPLTFGAIALLLSFVALVACYLPARRAAHVDPVEALRAE